MSLTSIRLLGRHLTMENYESVLGKATHRTRREIEALVAELAPRPDVPSAVRKLPCPTKTPALLSGPGPAQSPGPGLAVAGLPSSLGTAIAPSASALPATPRPILQASAPDRYRVQFTIGKETHEKLRRLQALLCREIPNGDPGVIFDRALTVLVEKVEKTKVGATAKPRPSRPIRPGTDRNGSASSSRGEACKPGSGSRHVPREVQREVWERDRGQCAFESTAGRRCTERTFLEFHHIQPYAHQGPATVANISLRCWRHNQYEAELIFGPYGPSMVREACPS